MAAPALLVLAGCGAGPVIADSSNGSFSITPTTEIIDTNCTGCNSSNASGALVEQFTATLSSGGAAAVLWSVSGGDGNSGPGTITSSGQYTPPPYLTNDRVSVLVTAKLNSTTTATAVLTVTPGFQQPLTPENAAVGANGQLTVTGYIAEAGGYTSINYALSNTATGSSGGQGSLGATNCTRGAEFFSYCTVTYAAPTAVTATGTTYIVGTVGTSASKTATAVLLNTQGVSSSPTTHQAQLSTPVALGSSGGNNNDYDTQGKQIADCCGGTLGSLIQDSSGHQYVLSNNHVLARSDHGTVGDRIIQPGLIDNNCTPYGDGPGTTPVGSLTGWLALSSSATNADAAIAQVDSGAVSTTGSILELGVRQADGSLGAAPPGISATGGKGEAASLNLVVAKSGRTTGLTCASVSALDLDVTVDYYLDCAETKPYLTKTYTNQLAGGPVFYRRSRCYRRKPGRGQPRAGRAERIERAGGRGNKLHIRGQRGSHGELPELWRQHGVRSSGSHAERRGDWAGAKCIVAGQDAGQSVRGNSGRGHGQEQRPSRRGRGDDLCG
jgi:hypothetical protein